jgi:hypothetical protein
VVGSGLNIAKKNFNELVKVRCRSDVQSDILFDPVGNLKRRMMTREIRVVTTCANSINYLALLQN